MPTDLIVAAAIVVAVVLALGLVMLSIVAGKAPPAVLAVPMAAPSADPTTLAWCQGCGCRHRHAWMNFDELGRYRCAVCCRDYTAASPAATRKSDDFDGHVATIRL